MTLIERIVDFKDDCSKSLICRIEIPDGYWIGGVV